MPRLARGLDEPAHHLVVLVAVDEQARAGVAGLAAVVVDRLVGALDGLLEVRVGEDDVGRLAAELERHALERAARLRADLAPDGSGAGEGDLVDARMVHERRAGLAVARDHVEHALRQTGLERQLAEPQCGERCLLGRLQHDRAARRERRAGLPRRHQEREVPGDDLAGHAHRLLARVAVHAALGDRQHLARDARGPAGEVANVLGRQLHVHPLRELDRLAVVERLELRELVGVRVDRVGQREHRARPLRGRDPAPAAVVERLARCAYRAVDVLGAGIGNQGDHPAGRQGRACRTSGRRRPRGARRRSAAGGVLRRTSGRRRRGPRVARRRSSWR